MRMFTTAEYGPQVMSDGELIGAARCELFTSSSPPQGGGRDGRSRCLLISPPSPFWSAGWWTRWRL